MRRRTTVSTGHPGLRIDAHLFQALTTELARRGGGRRESGAFLLASTAPEASHHDGRHVVTAIAYYDDLDPTCLTGGITFTADGYTALAALCRRDRVRAVADIHTHPRDRVCQSPIDSAHPMIALPGHIALIAPHYAQGAIGVRDLGAHVLGVAGRWTSFYGDDVATVVHLTRPGPVSRARAWARRARQLRPRWTRQLAVDRSTP
jgi:hypothetical protein